MIAPVCGSRSGARLTVSQVLEMVASIQRRLGRFAVSPCSSPVANCAAMSSTDFAPSGWYHVHA